MSAEEILAELEQVLAVEREAIRAADADAFLEAATQKEKLAADLVEAGAWTRADMAEGLGRLVEDLRNNGALLAEARDRLRDVIAALHGSRSAESMRKIAVRLSVRR